MVDQRVGGAFVEFTAKDAKLNGAFARARRNTRQMGQSFAGLSRSGSAAFGQLTFGAQDFIQVMSQPGMGVAGALRATTNNLQQFAFLAAGPVAGGIAGLVVGLGTLAVGLLTAKDRTKGLNDELEKQAALYGAINNARRRITGDRGPLLGAQQNELSKIARQLEQTAASLKAAQNTVAAVGGARVAAGAARGPFDFLLDRILGQREEAATTARQNAGGQIDAFRNLMRDFIDAPFTGGADKIAEQFKNRLAVLRQSRATTEDVARLEERAAEAVRQANVSRLQGAQIERRRMAREQARQRLARGEGPFAIVPNLVRRLQGLQPSEQAQRRMGLRGLSDLLFGRGVTRFGESLLGMRFGGQPRTSTASRFMGQQGLQEFLANRQATSPTAMAAKNTAKNTAKTASNTQKGNTVLGSILGAINNLQLGFK